LSGTVTDESPDIRLILARGRGSAAHALSPTSAPGRRARSERRRPGELRSEPSVWSVGLMPADFPGRDAVVRILDLVARELDAFVATFFTLDDEGELQSTVVHGSHLPPGPLADEVRGWEKRLRGIDPLAPAAIAGQSRPIVSLADVGGARRAVLDKVWVRGTYQQIGAINDLRLLIRAGDRLVAGVTLWRRLPATAWSGAQLRRLAALQPLIELAYLSCLQTTSSIDARLPDTLTPRQRQVARLLARGATNPDVARALQISLDTAKSHTQAVFTKLEVNSRRELVQRLGRPGDPPGMAWSARRPRAERAVLLGGDEASRRLLAPVLGWSAERIDALVGGCAAFSARQELAGQAWGVVPGIRDADLRAARHVHMHVVPHSPSELISQLEVAPGRVPVLELDSARELTASLGMTTPLVGVLRRHGRIAGLVWLCRVAGAWRDRHEAVRALRAVHPLLELTQVHEPADRHERASAEEELIERGLSARELEVAKLALEGAGNTAIGQRLSISQSTVKKHMGRILAKCGVASRNQLIAQLGVGPADD
jgi:DNA-binding NarL/FixJ family response regulator